MCGFAGIVDTAGRGRVSRSLLGHMTDSIAHRGPDGRDSVVAGNFGAGFSRLAIIDVAGGAQPLTNEDATIFLVCNGEIFNFETLTESLKDRGHRFRSHTDVEVLVHLYEDYGSDLVHHLEGQFSFAIYDSRRQRLFAAVDRFGL